MRLRQRTLASRMPGSRPILLLAGTKAHVRHETGLLLLSCMAAFVTGIVIAGARLFG